MIERSEVNGDDNLTPTASMGDKMNGVGKKLVLTRQTAEELAAEMAGHHHHGMALSMMPFFDVCSKLITELAISG